MSTMTINASRTEHLLDLMKKGDDAFNSRDFGGMRTTHHPDIIAHIMGIPDPILGRVAHAAMIQQMIRVFPDIHVHNDPYRLRKNSGSLTKMKENDPQGLIAQPEWPTGFAHIMGLSDGRFEIMRAPVPRH